MLFAGLATSAAIDLLSLLQPEKPKAGSGAKKTSFTVPDLTAAQPSSQVPSARGSGTAMSSDALGTLLSAQGHENAHSAQHKKRSISVLLDLLQSSQDGTVSKSDFQTALGTGDDTARATDMFDQIDRNQDRSVNSRELEDFIATYRRTSEAASSAGKGRALAVAA